MFRSAVAWTIELETKVSDPVPSASAFPKESVPAFRSVPPENVFCPPNTSVPAPALVRLPVPLMIPFSVSVREVGVLIVPFAFSTMLFVKVTEAPAYSVVLFAAKVSDPVPSACAFPTVNPPAFNVVPAVYVFTPFNVWFPVPFFTRVPVPEITPE